MDGEALCLQMLVSMRALVKFNRRRGRNAKFRVALAGRDFLVPTGADIRMVYSPLDALKVAHAGRFVTENVSVSPLGSLAEGWNE